MLKNILFLNFIISCCLGGGIYLAQLYQQELPLLINNYLNDFLIIPITLTICLYVLRFTRNNKTYKIPVFIIGYLCILFSVFFEKIMPGISERYTSDTLDVLVYFLGGLWFLFLQNNKLHCDM